MSRYLQNVTVHGMSLSRQFLEPKLQYKAASCFLRVTIAAQMLMYQTI